MCTGFPAKLLRVRVSVCGSETHTCQLLESWSRDTFEMWCDLDYDREAIVASAKPSIDFQGGPGAYSPGKFWKSRLSNKHFLSFGQWFYTFTARKYWPKIYTKCLAFRGKWQEKELFNQNNALILYRFFVWITAQFTTDAYLKKKTKDTDETWIPTEEQREQAKGWVKIVFLGIDRDKSAFLGRRDVGFRSPNRDCPDEIGAVGKYGNRSWSSFSLSLPSDVTSIYCPPPEVCIPITSDEALEMEQLDWQSHTYVLNQSSSNWLFKIVSGSTCGCQCMNACRYQRYWGLYAYPLFHHAAIQSGHFVDRAGWQAKIRASVEFWIPWRNVHGPIG